MSDMRSTVDGMKQDAINIYREGNRRQDIQTLRDGRATTR